MIKNTLANSPASNLAARYHKNIAWSNTVKS